MRIQLSQLANKSRPKVHISERVIEYHTSKQIEGFFTIAGYSRRTLPLTQAVEKKIPADFVFGIPGLVKIFGLQYKVLYGASTYDFWSIQKAQHTRLSHFNWILYGLSELTRKKDLGNALHALRLKRASFKYSPRLKLIDSQPYVRWWSFYQGLLTCRVGTRAESRDRFRQILIRVLDEKTELSAIEEALDIFAINISSRRVLRLSSSSD